MLYHVAERSHRIVAVAASLWSPAAREVVSLSVVACGVCVAVVVPVSWCRRAGGRVDCVARVALASWRELPPSQLAVATSRVSTESVVSTVSTAAVGG